jgi:hypothetical protein
MRRAVVVAAALVALAAAGSAAGRPQAAPLPLPQRVLHAGELGGLAPVSSPRVTRSAADWGLQSNMDPGALRRNRFVAGIWEQLQWPARQWAGLSSVGQFGSPKLAAAVIGPDVAARIAQAKGNGGTGTPFAVPGIPGARGLSVTSRGTAGYDVEFADGPFWYLVGVGFAAGNARDAKAQLLAAAHRLYRRVHGRPPG